MTKVSDRAVFEPEEFLSLCPLLLIVKAMERFRTCPVPHDHTIPLELVLNYKPQFCTHYSENTFYLSCASKCWLPRSVLRSFRTGTWCSAIPGIQFVRWTVKSYSPNSNLAPLLSSIVTLGHLLTIFPHLQNRYQKHTYLYMWVFYMGIKYSNTWEE